MSRATFASRLGAVAAAVGSAVGLGNIWRFPYETGQNGGGAFLLIYVLSVMFLGIPLLIAEFTIGRSAHANVSRAFKMLAPGTKWYLTGVMGMLVAVIILGFYTVILGWTLCYTWRALTNDFAMTVATAQTVDPQLSSADVMAADFSAFSSSVWSPILWMAGSILINAVIMLGGVQKGLERASRIMMPALAVLLLILVVNSCLLPGFAKGCEFFFYPDFSKVTGRTIITAMGQAFFSLSVAMGIMLAYGSYLGDNTKIGKTALSIASLDTLIAVLAGVVIFPACYSYGIDPGKGPGLVFITLPNVFMQMPGGYAMCLAFFMLVLLAGLTSCMSLFEVPISYLQEEHRMSRRVATMTVALVVCSLGVLSSLSLGIGSGVTVLGNNFFDLADKLTSLYMMPIGGILISLFVGWRLDRSITHDALTNWRNDSGWYLRPLIIGLRYVVPVLIAIVFVGNLI
ncbi:MAG: sodium-dependent transporter [Bacteroidales bacterium]|nr:sodium-dependent transporter [Candidatus Liminaster caballi]